uniref:Tyrosine-protein phosphatase domain-containing protein n=1 Tax=Angiostrongylus cantonensis TaxID=6313 RepID=A0A0K0DJ59_ANGCA
MRLLMYALWKVYLKDVGCLDHCRVVLNIGNVSYIHANYVSTPDNSKRFICTQAPLPSTCPEFWCMVVQEKSAAVLMLCNFVEQVGPFEEAHMISTAPIQNFASPFSVLYHNDAISIHPSIRMIWEHNSAISPVIMMLQSKYKCFNFYLLPHLLSLPLAAVADTTDRVKAWVRGRLSKGYGLFSE